MPTPLIQRDLVYMLSATAAEWTEANPILGDGETGVETDTGRTKSGDGTTAWTSLDYLSPRALLGYVAHGATAATARTGNTPILWVGTVNPSNATNGDVLYRSDTGRFYVRVSSAWAEPSGIETPCLPPRDGEYTSPVTVSSSTTQPLNGVANFSAYWLPKGFTITKLHARVTTGGSAGALCRLFVYKDNGKGEPGALLVDGGTIDATSTTPAEKTVSAVCPYSGWYHFGAATQGAPATTPIYRACKPATQATRHPTLASVLDGNQWTVAYKTGITGAAPDPLGATAADAGSYAIAVAFAGTNP